jgi:hypothetical protein
MVIERTGENDADRGQIFEVEVRQVASGAVVFEEILMVLVIRSSEFRKRPQVVRCTGVGFQRTGSRLVSTGIWSLRQHCDPSAAATR